MKNRIIIVDDEPDMRKIATDLLVADGYSVCSYGRPSEALKKIRDNPPDLLLLDIRLPELDGLEVCKQIKSEPKIRNLPIIMVSAKTDESDVVLGLELGADDYITKPIRKRELLARVKTVLRRTTKSLSQGSRLQLKDLSIDFEKYKAHLKNELLDLTPKEFQLLALFIQKEGRILTRANISESIWGFEYTGSTRTIDVHVDSLRHKLGPHYAPYIQTLRGVGYRFESEGE